MNLDENILFGIIRTDNPIGFFLILITVVGISIYIFHKAFFTKWAQSFFEKSLANHKSDLLREVGIAIVKANSELQTDIIKLTSKINILSGQESNWLNEKRKSIVNLHVAQVDFSQTIAWQSSLDLYINNKKSVEDREVEMNLAHHKYSKAFAVFHIFCDDRELFEKVKELGTNTIHLKRKRAKQLYEVAELQLTNKFLIKTYSAEEQKDSTSLSDLKDKLRGEVSELISRQEKEFYELFMANATMQDEVCYKMQTIIKSIFNKES